MTFGHEFTGVVEEVGPDVQKLKVGDHVLVPFNIACGKCVFCQQELYGNCHESNSQATAVGGIFGYSHTAGGYNGGQSEYVRVPYADVGPTVIPSGMDLDDAVLLTDVVPTGYQVAEMAGIQTGDTVCVFGAGPVGIMAARCVSKPQSCATSRWRPAVCFRAKSVDRACFRHSRPALSICRGVRCNGTPVKGKSVIDAACTRF